MTLHPFPDEEPAPAGGLVSFLAGAGFLFGAAGMALLLSTVAQPASPGPARAGAAAGLAAAPGPLPSLPFAMEPVRVPPAPSVPSPRVPEIPPSERLLAGPLARDARACLAEIDRILVDELGVPSVPAPPKDPTASMSRLLPAWLNLRYLQRRVSRGMRACGLSTARTSLEPGEAGSGTLRVGVGTDPGFEVELTKPRARARVALLVDDIGHGGPSTRRLLGLRFPLNLAILPFYPGSKAALQKGVAEGQDAMLHMPMQPKAAEGKYFPWMVVHQGLEPAELRRRTAAAIEDLPGIVGINNHMGSEATESWYVMSEVLGVLAARGLFFVDSLTSQRSVAYKTAQKLGVPASRRSYDFLDNEPSREAVEGCIRALARAVKRGEDQVAILHDKPESVAALEAAVPDFRTRDIELAFAAELVR